VSRGVTKGEQTDFYVRNQYKSLEITINHRKSLFYVEDMKDGWMGFENIRNNQKRLKTIGNHWKSIEVIEDH
jgi:hypothetical protein